MPLFTGTQQRYYDNAQSFTGDGSTTEFTLLFNPLPTDVGLFIVFINNQQVSQTLYDATPYNSSTGVITFDTAPAAGASIVVQQINFDENLGNYQFIELDDIINNFIISYVGSEKLITKVKRADVAFHAQRGLQELSYDTFKSIKSQEIELPPSLSMRMPHDYVNYVKLTWKDDDGIEHIIYPTRNTSNPSPLLQDDQYDYTYNQDEELLKAQDSNTWLAFQDVETTSSEDVHANIYDHLTDAGRRFGLNPETTQSNGLFYIDPARGRIYFSSDLTGKCITLKYISDSLGTEEEMVVHKFAEEAMYKYIAHAILSTRMNVPEYLVARFKKERFAAIRQAKLRLSSLKMEELAQVMRGKSKQIKH
jgi:hypothetical protein